MVEGTKSKSTPRIIFVLIGLILLLVGTGFLFGKVDLFPYSAVLWLMLIFTGILFLTRILMNVSSRPENEISFKPKRVGTRNIQKGKRTQFLNFPRNRLLCGLLLNATAILHGAIFGFAFLSETQFGNWLFLGGPSLFYFAGLIPGLIGFGLVLYAILARANLEITRKPDVFELLERRYFLEITTEIPRDSIQYVFLTNKKTGPRFLWIILLGLHSWFLMVDGFAYLTNPFAFGRGLVTGSLFIFQGAVNLIVIIVLVFFHQHHLEIRTETKRYELQFFPKNRQVIQSLLKLLEIPSSITSHGPLSTSLTPAGIFSKSWKNKYLAIFTGLVFILYAIFSAVFRFQASTPLQVSLLLSGTILLVKGLKEDLVPGQVFESKGIESHTHSLVIESIGNKFFTVEFFPKIESSGVNCTKTPRPLDFWDLLILTIIPTLAGLNLGISCFLLPETTSFAPGMVALQGIVLLLLTVLIALLFILPKWYSEISVPNFSVLYPLLDNASISTSKNLRLRVILLRIVGLLIEISLGFFLAFYSGDL